jgi:phosphate starvation-inducible protein PhoH and related proteins
MEKLFKLKDTAEARALFGTHDENLKIIEAEFSVRLATRGDALRIDGEPKGVELASRLIEELALTLRNGGVLKKHEILYAIQAIKKDGTRDIHSIYLDRIEVSSKRQFITPKSAGQKDYIDAIRNNDIVFCIGPAGTGKTYLAMAMAVNALKKQLVSRIILTRPAVEAGESLGFLPGDLYQKVTPYVRPLYDALYDMMEVDKINDFVERGVIEIVPLAYMRGRTLNDSFIIMDEAQNSTPEQMKMFLTRLGFDSKTVITGDVTQSDLPINKMSGLSHVREVLGGIDGIKFVYLKGEDVVRHELVQDIIKAYDRFKK